MEDLTPALFETKTPNGKTGRLWWIAMSGKAADRDPPGVLWVVGEVVVYVEWEPKVAYLQENLGG